MSAGRIAVFSISLGLLFGGPAKGAGGDEPGAELVLAQVRALQVDALAPGARAELSLVLLEAPNRDLPLLLRIEQGPVEVDDDRLDWSAVVDPLALQPRLRAGFTAPPSPGSYEVQASVEYFVCGERWCRLKRAPLRWTLTVE